MYIACIVPVILLLVLVNWRAHSPGDSETVLSQLRFLGDSLHDGSGERMQSTFPEGYVFTWALYGLASAQVAQQLPKDDPRRAELRDRAWDAIDHVDSPVARSTFPKELDPPYGAFYCAWSLYLRAEYMRVAGADELPPGFIKKFEEDCAEFAHALDRSQTPFLPSYPAAAWPVDTCVAIAALSIRDRVLGTKYEPVIKRWVADARSRLDSKFNVLSHAADPRTGAPAGGVRGSSLTLMSRVLAEVDPDFASEQYAVLKNQFADCAWGLPGIREYPHGTSGPGDVDSGPLVFGFSGSASVVGASAARAHGDEELATTLLGAVEVAGVPIEWRGRRRYVFGAVPVGDAFIAWARSSEPLPSSPATRWERTLPSWWAYPAHAVSLAAIALLLFPLRRFRYKSEVAQGKDPAHSHNIPTNSAAGT